MRGWGEAPVGPSDDAATEPMRIRPLTPGDASVLRNLLHHAIHVPPGLEAALPPRGSSRGALRRRELDRVGGQPGSTVVGTRSVRGHGRTRGRFDQDDQAARTARCGVAARTTRTRAWSAPTGLRGVQPTLRGSQPRGHDHGDPHALRPRVRCRLQGSAADRVAGRAIGLRLVPGNAKPSWLQARTMRCRWRSVASGMATRWRSGMGTTKMVTRT